MIFFGCEVGDVPECDQLCAGETLLKLIDPIMEAAFFERDVIVLEGGLFCFMEKFQSEIE